MLHRALLFVSILSACGEVDSPDARDAIALRDGDLDGLTSCQITEGLQLVNEAKSADELKAGGVHSRAADNLLATRDGLDGVLGNADDVVFGDLYEIDEVPYVGPVAMEQILAWAQDRCDNGVADAPCSESNYDASCAEQDVVFSPKPMHLSHLARVVDEIDAAERSIDVAMYSFSDASVMEALERAAGRGISVRFVYDGASDDRKDPAGTRSARLEDAGIEVRWVNKIQHHKFAVIDGPRQDVAQASSATLLNGSGNWSNGAATRFDENMTVLRGDARLVLLYQQEFNLLWDNSRDLVWNETIAPVPAVAITDADIASADGSDAIFTSGNFRTYVSSAYGPTFSANSGSSVVSDRLVELISGAERSIWIASGHLRSRPITDALLAKAEEGLDIRVYLDGQEYTSEWYFAEEQDDWDDCMDDAPTPADCDDIGQHFGIALHKAGIDLRYKYYAYRWDYSYADQMHHKYLIVDGRTVASGSYNLSPNAEYDTFENVAFYSVERYPELVSAFEDNFQSIWRTGEGRYEQLLTEVYYGTGDIPLVFDPMALDWQQVNDLKDAISEVCPAADSTPFRTNPAAHRYCDR